MPIRESIRDASFSVRAISEKASRREDVVRLDIGQPDFRTPPVVRDAMSEVVQREHVRYTSLWGMEELREAAATYESGKMDLGAANVMVTTGGMGGLFCIMNGLLGRDDTVVMNDPAWMPYRLIARTVPGGAEQVPYIDGEGVVNEERIRSATEDASLLILNTPENPTGRVYTAGQVETIASIAAENDCIIVADEVYDHLLYDGAEHISPAEVAPEQTILVNSVSKNFAMTGWRLGWIAARDEDLIHELGKVNRAATACPNYPAQKAALVALRDARDYTEEMRTVFAERRELVLQRVDDLGWTMETPDGAIYAFPDVDRDSWTFANELVEQAGVSVVPGEAAGEHSDTNIRLCFGSATLDELEEAFDRIEAFVR